jgi:hypothetical protein
LDFVLLPGGFGTFAQADNPAMLAFIAANAGVDTMMSVCSGSGVLARAGILNGRKATSNKLFFDSITQGSSGVDWQRNARWVEDGNVFTSSGVSAGTDMSLAVIAKIYGSARAQAVAVMTEYEWQSDPANDPFAQYINQGDLAEYLRLIGKACAFSGKNLKNERAYPRTRRAAFEKRSLCATNKHRATGRHTGSGRRSGCSALSGRGGCGRSHTNSLKTTNGGKFQ